MSKIVTRAEVKEVLIKWQQGDIDAKYVNDWAGNLYPSTEVDYDDWEADDSNSITNEVLAALDMLDMNLLTVEDIPAYVEFLNTPQGDFNKANAKLQRYLRSIDISERKKQLAQIKIYAPFCD